MMSQRRKTILQHGDYTIQSKPAKLYPYEVRWNLFRTLHFLSWTVWLTHLLVDLSLAYKVHLRSAQVPWRLWSALVSDLLLTIPDLIVATTLILAICSSKAAKPRPRYGLQGHRAPSVDIMITSCGEPTEVVVNTVTAAASQDYPGRKFRVFVLDDGNDAGLKYAVDLLNMRHKQSEGPLVIYLSRTKAPELDSHFKSGNLRFGIEQSKVLGQVSEIIAGLDADMIAEPTWLREMVPHLLLNERVAIAATPQRYYNVPTQDPLGQQADFDIYFSVQELLNDYLGAPMCTGTGYVARRRAIADIGGWPLAHTGEDYMCSALLTGAGWDVVFVRSHLQLGLAPESLTAAMKQRMRWTDAGLEVHQRLAPYTTSSPLTARMKASVRAVNLLYMIRDYSPLTTCLAAVVLPLVLWPQGDVDHFLYTSNEDLALPYWALALSFATFLLGTLRSYVTYSHLDLSLVSNIYAQEIWSAPYSAYRNLISLLSLLPLPSRSSPTFTVCGAINDSTSERSATKRAPLHKRLTRIDTLLYLLYILYASAPIVLRTRQAATGFVFPCLLLRELALVVAVCKPVVYMIWPPTAPKWEELVCEGEDGVRRPRRKGSRGGGTGRGWYAGVFLQGVIVLACFGRW